MKTFLIVIELITALVLIVAVMLHSAKGEGLGGIGGNAKIFNSQKNLEAGLTRFTSIAAAIFMGVAFILSIL